MIFLYSFIILVGYFIMLVTKTVTFEIILNIFSQLLVLKGEEIKKKVKKKQQQQQVVMKVVHIYSIIFICT